MTSTSSPDLGVGAGEFFLATTALDEFWDKSAKVVFLGEWCRRYGNEAAWRGLNASIIEDLWSDPRRRADAYRRINELYEWLLPCLGARLNNIHNVSHGNQYWRLVIGNWLYYYISTLFDRHAHLAYALERYPGIRTVVLASECHVVPKDSLEAVRWAITDSYSLQTFGRILDALGRRNFPKVTIRQKVAPIEGAGRARVVAWLLLVFRDRLSKLLARIGRGRVILYKSYFSRFTEFCLAMGSGGGVLPSFLLEENIPRVAPDMQMRQRLMDDLSLRGDEFESVLAKLLPFDIPQCFIEGYGFVASQAKKFPGAPRAILSSNGWAYDEAFKQWAGACAENGTQLLCSQHGGGYTGIGTYSPYEYFEISIADRYYSWGWSPEDEYRDKVKPMSATYLAGRKMMPADNRDAGVLYLATAEPRYILSLQDISGHFVNYLKWQAKFMAAMFPLLKCALRVRLYPEDFGWDIRNRWCDHSPGVVFDDVSRKFIESLEDSRLFVCDHMGTTLYEALAADKPTVCFFDPQKNPLKSQARTVFASLRAAGIVQDTPEGAAETVAQAYPDVEAWWNEPRRQAARQEFCDKFARLSSNPLKEWLNEFERIRR